MRLCLEAAQIDLRNQSLATTGCTGFKDVRPACTVAYLAAVVEVARNLRACSGAVRAFPCRLRNQHAALTITYQADIPIIAILAFAFTPGTGLWCVLHDWHYHSIHL